MLTTVLEDVRNVMMAGHLVVVLTFLWMQPRLLIATMGGMEATERIKQVVSEAIPAPEASTLPESDADTNPVVEQEASETPEQNPVAHPPVTSDDETSAGADSKGDAIGEDVSWTEPEVLANDVAWDDDEIELLD